jgi:hypothetical protein
LLDPAASERATLFDINFRPTDIAVEDLREGFVDLVRRLYHPDFVRHRERKFRGHMKAGIRERR